MKQNTRLSGQLCGEKYWEEVLFMCSKVSKTASLSRTTGLDLYLETAQLCNPIPIQVSDIIEASWLTVVSIITFS